MTNGDDGKGVVRRAAARRVVHGGAGGDGRLQMRSFVIGSLTETDYPENDDREDAAARLARIQRFREETREQRMRIADEAEARTGRKVAWGASCGDESCVFTSLSVPVMTRLRMSERLVLDTLVGGGVARSRS